jgi:hypothetical protein
MNAWGNCERMQSGIRLIDGHCPMPLTQIDLADIAGFTPAHRNRVLKPADIRPHRTTDALPRPVVDHLPGIGSGSLPGVPE